MVSWSFPILAWVTSLTWLDVWSGSRLWHCPYSSPSSAPPAVAWETYWTSSASLSPSVVLGLQWLTYVHDTQHAANYPGALTLINFPEPFFRPPYQQRRGFLLRLRLTLLSWPGTPPSFPHFGEALSLLPLPCLLHTSTQHPSALFHLKVSSINTISLCKYFPTSILFFRETNRKSGTVIFFKGQFIIGLKTLHLSSVHFSTLAA